ncbi:alcohol dehydrogenase [Oscillibacter sp. PC13]|uniref:iron-containing alcohol dehydrogenase n=1 Tax=Oscillibacter sp. PC13 TaxID=1855299 RepID=UPI0008E83E8E|nr:iron-containing alcohol dehydrogenase [Oscillibacter sp. PC13]SFQ16038.1 alcohol dehydrogenase [Oscillibacter sp. PC13]
MGLSTYSFKLPTRVEFGSGVINKVGQEAKALGATKVMIISDKGVINAGLVKPVEESLTAAGIDYMIFDHVVANPRITSCNEGAEIAKAEKVNFLVAVGGGSPMDTAKAIGTLLTHGKTVQDWCGDHLLEREITPLIAIPTTAGTGSEVTPFAVVTDTEAHKKLNIFDDRAAAKVALIDPGVLMNLPSHVMASTGVDALTHAVESYTCTVATPHTDAYALYAIELISKNIRDAVHTPTLENCTGMMLGSTIAGIAFGCADCAAIHCMAEAIGGRYDTPHGVSCAVFLPSISRYNVPSDTEKYANIAKALGINTFDMTLAEAAEAGIKELENICVDVGIPKFRDLKGVNVDDFPALAKASSENVSNGSNPRPISEEEYLRLFHQIYNE